ncbi:MAG: hypothetical protein FWC80_00400 [Firmicutes bacterium]|nr:hypothetical protein [Bacillota bacterium]
MMISGETMPFVEALDFGSKDELLEKLQDIKKRASGLSQPDRLIVEEMIMASIEEIEYCDEHELLNFKQYLVARKQ